MTDDSRSTNVQSTKFDDPTPTFSVTARRSSSFKVGQNVDHHATTSSSSGAARSTCNKTFNNYQYCRLQYGGSVKYYTRPPSRDPVPIKERISGRKGFLQQSQSNPLSRDDDGRQDGDGVAGGREAASSPSNEPIVDEKLATTSRDGRIFPIDHPNFAGDTVLPAAAAVVVAASPATPSLNLVRRHPNFFSFSTVGGFSGGNTSANMDNNNRKVSINSQDGTNCLGAAALIHNAQQRNFFTRQDSMDHSSSTSRRYSPFVRGGTAKSRFLMSAGVSNLTSVQSRPDSPVGETPTSSAGVAPSAAAVVATPAPPKPPILLNKQKLLALAPPSLHISFECTEQSKNQRRDHMPNLAGSLSSDNIRGYRHSIAIPRNESSLSPLRRDLLKQKQKLRQSEFAQISAEYMRINGITQNFKGLFGYQPKSHGSGVKVNSSVDTVAGAAGENSTSSLKLTKESPSGRRGFLNKNYSVANNSSCNQSIDACHKSLHHLHSVTTNGDELECRLIDECTKCDQSLNNSAQYRGSLVQSEFRPSVDYSQTKSNNINNANAANNAAGAVDDEADDDFDVKFQVSRRLRRRNELFDFRRKLTDYSLLVAVLGVILMIVENELTTSFNDFRYKESIYSYCLKSSIVMFTLLLLALIVWFHAVEIMIFMSDNSCDDWRIAITRKRVLTLSIELLICSICPVPGELYFDWPTVHANGVTRTVSKVPVDVLLSIPMFLRCYLICRVMLLRSKLCTDASSRSIGALNRITFTSQFIIKTLMTSSPGTVLLTLTLSFWLIAAWVMRACERWHVGDPPQVEAEKFQSYLNSLWLIAITSLTVGYGDMVPNTYCGRAVSVICGMMGAGTSSLVVAVVAKKLELTRAEKHVHYFMMDSQLTKMLKTAAANVLRETWLIYKHRKLVDKMDLSKIRLHQRKFLVAIYAMRKVKRDQKKLSENNFTISDIAKSVTDVREKIEDFEEKQVLLEQKLSCLEHQYNNLENTSAQMFSYMQRLPELISAKIARDLNLSPIPQQAVSSTMNTQNQITAGYNRASIGNSSQSSFG